MRLMILPALLIFLFLGVYPTLQGLYNSLCQYRLTEVTGRKFIGLGNYIQMFTTLRFWQALWHTVLFVTLSVMLTYCIGLLVSMLLTKTARMRNFYRIIFILPMMIASTITALNFSFMYNYSFGIINYLLEAVGLARMDFLGNASISLYSTLLVDVWQGIPLALLILLAGLEAQPVSLYEAAMLDGASSLQTFRYVTMPLLSKFSVIVIVLRMMDSLKVYETINLMTGGGPGNASETLNIYISKAGFMWFDMGYASAMGIFALYFIMFVANRIIKSTGIFSSAEAR